MRRREHAADEFGELGREAARRVPAWVQPLTSRAREHLQAVGSLASGPPTAAADLARLRVLGALHAIVQEQLDAAVYAAGSSGASYAQIGDALEMTRQNARKRWPDAVDHPPGRLPHAR